MKLTQYRDIALVCIALAWLVVSMIPVGQLDPDRFTLFGIERDFGYFVYDAVNKFSGVLGFGFALIPDKGRLLTSLTFALFGDWLFDNFDLWVTDDSGSATSLYIQNAVTILFFIIGYLKNGKP